MNYEGAMDYIKTLYDEKRIILGLERVRTLMNLVGDPHLTYPSAIITGTNGKGSTSTYISAILKASGLKVGTNLSPHVQDITERFMVDLEQISTDTFADLTFVFKDAIEKKWPSVIERPTFHELMTAMAFYLFAQEKVDFAVMEVGMGGRYDACNIVDNKLSVFTPIHYDHCRYLGDTLQAISLEKAQIMKAGGVAVSAPQPPQVRKILNTVAEKFNTDLQFLDVKRFTYAEGDLLEPVKFHYKFNGEIDDDITLGVLGHYQVYNAALAILATERIAEAEIVRGFAQRFDKDVIRKGLTSVVSRHLPARLEAIGTNPAFIIDGGHNLHGIRCFMNELKYRKSNGSRIILVIGFKDGKNYFDALPMLETVDKIFFTTFENQGGVPPQQLKSDFEKLSFSSQKKVETENDPVIALERALNEVEDTGRDLVAIAGSLYLAGEVKNRLKSQKQPPAGNA